MKINVEVWCTEFGLISLVAENAAEIHQLSAIQSKLEDKKLDYFFYHDSYGSGEKGLTIKILKK